jgi:hypothetical protein
MKNVGNSLVFSTVSRAIAKVLSPGWLFVILVALSASAAIAQSAWPPSDNSGKPCFEYYLNVINLTENSHEMFWRQDDCIRVHVANNPFIYTYKVTFDEEKIAEDDVLGSLGTLLGLKTLSSSTAASPKVQSPKPGPTPQGGLTYGFDQTRPGKKPAKSNQCSTSQTKQEQQAVDMARSQIQAFAQQITNVESAADRLDNAVGGLANGLRDKEDAYTKFQSEYLSSRRTLLNRATDPIVLMQAAYNLQTDSLNVSNTLTNDNKFEAQFVDVFEAAKVNGESLDGLKDRISQDEQNLKAPDCVAPANQKDLADQLSAARQQLAALGDRVAADLAHVQLDAARIANTACQYNARKQGEFSWVRDQVYSPVSTVARES